MSMKAPYLELERFSGAAEAGDLEGKVVEGTSCNINVMWPGSLVGEKDRSIGGHEAFQRRLAVLGARGTC